MLSSFRILPRETMLIMVSKIEHDKFPSLARTWVLHLGPLMTLRLMSSFPDSAARNQRRRIKLPSRAV